MTYRDFDLLVERTGAGLRARVLASPAGTASAEFSLPLTDVQLENFLLRVGRSRRTVRRAESSELQAAKNFGAMLFAAVFSGEVAVCFRKSAEEARRKSQGLRIRLRLGDASLADLPWEYLYSPTVNRFTALSIRTPLVRYMDLPDPIGPISVTPPIRALVMISSPADYPQLDVEGEWSRLNEALSDLVRSSQLVVDRLDNATLSALQRQLRQESYHIFHFIGHGEFDQAAQEGVLILKDDEGRGHRVGSQSLGMLLHDHSSLRVAILNACEGARTSAQDPFAGSAQTLVQQGIPAVIAMQFEIADEVAATFAHEFYGALSDGYPIDAAVTEARKAIFAAGNDVEWATPVLYLRAPDGRIFDLEPSSFAASQREAQRALRCDGIDPRRWSRARPWKVRRRVEVPPGGVDTRSERAESAGAHRHRRTAARRRGDPRALAQSASRSRLRGRGPLREGRNDCRVRARTGSPQVEGRRYRGAGPGDPDPTGADTRAAAGARGRTWPASSEQGLGDGRFEGAARRAPHERRGSKERFGGSPDRHGLDRHGEGSPGLTGGPNERTS